MGRPRVIKHHLKSKSDALNALTTQTMNNLKKRHPSLSSSSSTCPNGLMSAIQPIREKITRLSSELNSENSEVLNGILNSLTDSQLVSLKQTFDKKIKKNTEDRIFESSFTIIEEMESLNSMVEFIQSVQTELVELWTKVLIKEVHVEQGNSFTFDITRLEGIIGDIQNYRKGIKRATERQHEGSDVREDEGQCCLM